MNKKWPKHLYVLDISRGVAALSVVLWHWRFFAIEENIMPHDFNPENQPMYAVLRLFYENGSMGVKYFFLLSGFIFFWLYGNSIKNKKINSLRFSIHRFSRLYPLHLMTLLCVAFLQFIYTYREGYSFAFPFNDIYHFILNVFFASHWGAQKGLSFNGPVWSVSIEILLYFVFFITMFYQRGGWLFCLLISASSFILSSIIFHPIFGGLAMFFLGGFIFHLTLMLSKKEPLPTQLVYCITILFWACVIFDCYIQDISIYILTTGKMGKIFLRAFPQYLLFPFTICSLALLEINKGPLLKSMSWVGNITYSSYLLHFPLQLLFAIAVSFGILDFNFYKHSIYIIFYFLILIPSSYITYIKFERPMQQVIRNKLLP